MSFGPKTWHYAGNDPSITLFDRAVTMWANGCDTWAIARNLGVEEWRVYNNLPKWRMGE